MSILAWALRRLRRISILSLDLTWRNISISSLDLTRRKISILSLIRDRRSISIVLRLRATWVLLVVIVLRVWIYPTSHDEGEEEWKIKRTSIGYILYVLKVIQGFKICFLSRANAPFDSSLQVTEETNGKSSPDNDLSAR